MYDISSLCCGVPQGSVLGPFILFSVATNDSACNMIQSYIADIIFLNSNNNLQDIKDATEPNLEIEFDFALMAYF